MASDQAKELLYVVTDYAYALVTITLMIAESNPAEKKPCSG